MSKKRVSIKDVAERAGVSPTTVSRVINNSDHPVNIETEKAVRKAIAELNFEPNRMAQGLIKNKSNIIGVIVHDISDDYFAEIVKGIERIISDNDYIVNIYNTYRDVEKELKSVNMLRANRAEAVVFTGGTLLDERYEREMGSHIENLKNNGSIVIGITDHPFEIKNINIGNTLAARTITEYLLNCGHRKLGYINGPEILGTTELRLKGFRQALANRNIQFNQSMVFKGDFSFEGGRKAALEVLDYKEPLTALVASNDETALGLMWELKNQGVEVPEEISVVGIGNIPSARYSYPPLTTVSLPIEKLGEQIGEYIMNSLQNNRSLANGFESQIGLIERESVRELT